MPAALNQTLTRWYYYSLTSQSDATFQADIDIGKRLKEAGMNARM